MSGLLLPGTPDSRKLHKIVEALSELSDAQAAAAATALSAGDAAGGDLGGTYPNPTVVTLDGRAVSAVVFDDDARLTDSRAPDGPAGGDLVGSFPDPTIKSDVGLTGAPTAPTAPLDTNTTQIATTAFVLGQAASGLGDAPVMDGATAQGTSKHYARADHVHPSDTSRAPLASPTFTGDPKAPTPAAGDNDTSIATSAFVQAAITALGLAGKKIAFGNAQISLTASSTGNVNVTHGLGGTPTLVMATLRQGSGAWAYLDVGGETTTIFNVACQANASITGVIKFYWLAIK